MLTTDVKGSPNRASPIASKGLLGRYCFRRCLRSDHRSCRLHRLAGLLTNIVTFLPTLIALRAWSLPKDLTSDQYTDWLVEFMMRGLGLLRLERDN
jgi:hypothetical protein